MWCSGLSERFHRGVPGSIPPRAWSSKGCSANVDGFAISGKPYIELYTAVHDIVVESNQNGKLGSEVRFGSAALQ